jgi:hypothetical protein
MGGRFENLSTANGSFETIKTHADYMSEILGIISNALNDVEIGNLIDAVRDNRRLESAEKKDLARRFRGLRIKSAMYTESSKNVKTHVSVAAPAAKPAVTASGVFGCTIDNKYWVVDTNRAIVTNCTVYDGSEQAPLKSIFQGEQVKLGTNIMVADREDFIHTRVVFDRTTNVITVAECGTKTKEAKAIDIDTFLLKNRLTYTNERIHIIGIEQALHSARKYR